MSNEANGRLVTVKTKFHREAVRPGGINRSGAKAEQQPAEQFPIKLTGIGHEEADLRKIDGVFCELERHSEYVF